MFFEDLIEEARYVCETVSASKKKVRHAVRVKEFDRRGGFMVGKAGNKAGQRLAMRGGEDPLSTKEMNKQDREMGEPAPTTRGFLRGRRRRGERMPGPAKGQLPESVYGKRKEPKKQERKLKQALGLRQLARRRGHELVRFTDQEKPSEMMKLLRGLSRKDAEDPSPSIPPQVFPVKKTSR